MRAFNLLHPSDLASASTAARMPGAALIAGGTDLMQLMKLQGGDARPARRSHRNTRGRRARPHRAGAGRHPAGRARDHVAGGGRPAHPARLAR